MILNNDIVRRKSIIDKIIVSPALMVSSEGSNTRFILEPITTSVADAGRAMNSEAKKAIRNLMLDSPIL